MVTVNGKQKEAMEQLQQLVLKQASASKATGIPGKDTHPASVSAATEHVNQNAVKPENNPQEVKQKPSKDSAQPGKKKAEEAETPAEEKKEEKAVVTTTEATTTPATTAAPEAKTAEANSSVEKLGKEILSMVEKFAQSATGVPGKDTNPVSVSAATESVNQNAVKPENNPQEVKQKPSTDPAKPAKTAEEENAEKTASFELGKLWAEMVIKQAQDQELAMYKEAGRRDFETLIQKAAQELQAQRAQQEKTAAAQEAALEKSAAEAGAEAFRQLYKQAQLEYAAQQLVEENRKLAAYAQALENEKKAACAKLDAELAEKRAALAAIENDKREQEKFASWASVISSGTANQIMERLRTELMPRN